jgi:hypothetical protein
MKPYIKVLIAAVIIGVLIAVFFYKDIKNEVIAITNNDSEISLFQVGVFKVYDNAINFSESFENSLIYEDNGLYRVIIGAAYHNEAKIKLEQYFTEQNITYYIKEIKMSDSFIEEITNFELILIKTESFEVINSLNKSIMDALKSVLSQ